MMSILKKKPRYEVISIRLTKTASSSWSAIRNSSANNWAAQCLWERPPSLSSRSAAPAWTARQRATKCSARRPLLSITFARSGNRSTLCLPPSGMFSRSTCKSGQRKSGKSHRCFGPRFHPGSRTSRYSTPSKPSIRTERSMPRSTPGITSGILAATPLMFGSPDRRRPETPSGSESRFRFAGSC